MSESEPKPTQVRWLTIPNVFSVLRLVVFVPLTVALAAQPGLEILATVSLALFGATDWIDGFLARRLGQVSRVGEILDPIADRVGIIAISGALVLVGKLPLWVVVTIVVCDSALLVIAILRFRRVLAGHVAWIGKVRTALLMSGMPLMLLSYAPQLDPEPLRSIALVLLAAGTIGHVLTAAHYAVAYLRPDAMPQDPPSRSR